MAVAYSRFTFLQVIVINSVQSVNNSNLKALENDQRQTCLEGRSSLKARNCSWEIHIPMFLPWGGPPPSALGTIGTPAESWGTTGWQSQETEFRVARVTRKGRNLTKEGAREEGAPNLHITFDQILRGPLSWACVGRFQEPRKKAKLEGWRTEQRFRCSPLQERQNLELESSHSLPARRRIQRRIHSTSFTMPSIE